MLAEAGYYDGKKFLPLKKLPVKRNQKIIITVLDEFVEPQEKQKKENDWESLKMSSERKKKLAAFEELEKYRGRISDDLDYKVELNSWREERYDSSN